MSKPGGKLALSKSSSRLNSQVVITGMGIISSIGSTIAQFDKALRMTQIGICESFSYPELHFRLCCAPLSDANITAAFELIQYNAGLPQAQLTRLFRKAPKSILAATQATIEAWQHAQMHTNSIDPTRIGLIIAGNNLSQAEHYRVYNDFSQAPDYLRPSYALQLLDTHYVGILSELLGIQGEGYTVGGASASGNVGLLHGLRLLQSGAADSCVVVGALADLSPPMLQAFYNIGALGGHDIRFSPEYTCRPFDEGHHGFIYGQGAACIILETADSAKCRQAPIIGRLLAASQVLDANHLSNPSVEGEARAMTQALAMAQLQPEDINYINAHGSSSPLGDKTELAACQQVFGEYLNHCWVNATKVLTGHCLWSAGLIEAIATLLQLQGGYVHGNPNLDHPINHAHFVGHQSEDADIKIALSNSFGFAGINTSVVLAIH